MTGKRHIGHIRHLFLSFLVLPPRAKSAHENRRLENRASCRQTSPDVDMDNSRELDRLLRRATRLAVIKKPPTLTLTVLEPGQTAPQEPSLWNLVLQIQPKVAY